MAGHDTASTALGKLRGEAKTMNILVGTLRGRRMRKREGVFDQFGALLQLPYYFSESWNAFVDCMCDLNWLNASGFALVHEVDERKEDLEQRAYRATVRPDAFTRPLEGHD